MNKIFNDYINAVKTKPPQKGTPEPEAIAVTLREIVAAEGVDVYRDVEKLSAALKAKDVDPAESKQIELAACGSSLTRYLEQLGNGFTAIDINNILRTTEKAGLSPKAARRTVSNILYSLNVPQSLKEVSLKMEDKELGEKGIYIPREAYENELKEISDLLAQKKKPSDEQLLFLNQLMEAGVPEAYRLSGKIYLDGGFVPQDSIKAANLLQYAAEHGDAESYGLLGDYFYEHDNDGLAYELYTRPGAMALGESRWKKMRNLEKSKRFIKMQFLMMALLVILMEIFLFLFSSSVLTGGHFLAAILCTVVNGLVLAGVFYVHWKDPYQDLRSFSLPFLITFFIYAFILL